MPIPSSFKEESLLISECIFLQLQATSLFSTSYWLIVKGSRSSVFRHPGDGQIILAILGVTLMAFSVFDWIPLWRMVKTRSGGWYITSLVFQVSNAIPSAW